MSKLNVLGDRTFERARGCWNCVSFENGDLAKQHWKACKQRDLAELVAAGRAPLDRLGDQEDDVFSGTFYDTVTKAITAGTMGICLKGKAMGDFVHHHFLCSDGWTGRQGASIATGGISGKVDKEIGELVELVDGKQPLK